MSTESALYPFDRITEYPRSHQVSALPGQVQGVYIALSTEILDATSARFAGWFHGREEDAIVDEGTSDKQGIGFILMEWSECEIDPLFLAILRDEEMIEDYMAYDRNLEV
jgi:hypothetical protein